MMVCRLLFQQVIYLFSLGIRGMMNIDLHQKNSKGEQGSKRKDIQEKIQEVCNIMVFIF